MKIEELNQKLLYFLHDFLNNHEKMITTNQINKIVKMGVDEKQAYTLLLSEYLKEQENEETTKEIINKYFPKMIHQLDTKTYMTNPYYQNIHFNKLSLNGWEFKQTKYEPFETFVCNDFIYDYGKIIPQIGYFNKPFYYPAVYQNKRLWMSVTPNEIETMTLPIREASGNVVTIGLGLGYFTYMVAIKTNVNKVIVIEKDPNVITLFQNYLLPQIKEKDKITIIQEDCFTFLDSHIEKISVDYLFIDIWHDVSDGLPLYQRIKPYENKYPEIKFRYWIEETIKYYL